MITLIHGNNDFSAQQELNSLRGVSDYQIVFADEAKTINELIFSTDNLSFFETDQKFTILKYLSKNRKKSLFNELADYLEKNFENINLVLYELNKFDARTKLFRIIKKHGRVIETKPLGETALLGWVTSRLDEEKINSDFLLNKKIINRVGVDQNTLSNELDKLTLLIHAENRTSIEEKDLLVLTENRDVVIWDFLDALARRDKKTALKILEDIYQKDSDFSYLSVMMAKQLKILYWLKSGDISEEQIKKDFGVHPYTISELKKNMSRFDINLLKLLFSKLTNLDFKVKQGKIEPKLGLILLISSV